MIRTYSELIRLPTFEERFEYLKLEGTIGNETFGFDRYLNQALYRSYEWRHFRRDIILRDCGCDLGIEGREISGYFIIHHMNPIDERAILDRDPRIMDPEEVITTTILTHNAIHYGSLNTVPLDPIVRRQNDTCPWR